MLKHKEENVIYILGAKGVGKTSLINLLVGREFNEKETHSKKGIKTSHYHTEDKNYVFKELSDDDNFSVTKNLQNCLEELNIILVMFSVDDEKSLEYAESIILFIKSNLTYNLELNIFLIGNKHDSQKYNNNTHISVNLLEAEKFALDNDIYDYYISCKNRINIESILKAIEETEDMKYIDKEENTHNDSIQHLGYEQPSGGSCEII